MECSATLTKIYSYPRTEEDEVQTKNVWLKGHTDSGVLTILWSQPVVGLQIMCPDGKWRYVRYIPNSVVCIFVQFAGSSDRI